MNYKSNVAIILFSLSSLFGCNSSDDTKTISSPNYTLNTAETTTQVEETEEDTTTSEDDENTTPVVSQQFDNGDFENWTDAIPNDWTTIEEGITVAQENSIIKTGATSIAITVVTGEQGLTDFRQSVDVESGKTYTLSMSVYHTEGYMKARVYLDGYYDYSDPNLVNEWQALSVDYTATETKTIEVGTRFYDDGSFDGSEVVYLDNMIFIESEDTSETPTIPEIEIPETPVVTDLVVNGGFELWSDAQPTGWTTIDSGIVLTQDNTTFKTGSSSVAISVNTASQSDTDLRQSIDVLVGMTYTLTMSVYHTEGNIKARGFLANYESYSDNLLINQWQDLSWEYTPTEDSTIEVGVRFYDQDGFVDSEIVYVDNITLTSSTTPVDIDAYYDSVSDMTGYTLKTGLYNIIKDHTTRTYADLWTFISTNTLDTYYENDNSILDIYTENPSASDSYNFIAVTDQCGNYSNEGDCYNREHSFPKSWFDDASPMVSDVHHIFATDGKVNGYRSNYPYGEVASATFTSSNGTLLGSPTTALGYTGTVFEPIDEFKGDLARAYFYMATRYQDIVGAWQENSDNANAVLDGSSDQVFEPWVISMLKSWNESDPVSQKEQDRNEAAYLYQGNRNPFVDHPEYINQIWAD
jgi:endonuclease I/uncharacterized protein (DUF2147 family)